MTTTAPQGRQPVSTAKRLTGREARQQVNELVSELSKDGKKGLTKLMRSMDTGSGSNMRTTLQDIKPYIDSTEVLLLTDTVHHKRNYTYRLRHPDATKTTFYNLVMREYNGHRRLTLITYKMGTTFALDFYTTGNMTKFTGQVVFEIITQDEGDPCEETPPASGGGGGGVWSNPYDGIYYPSSDINNHQYVVGTHFMELQTAQANPEEEEEEWIEVSRSPRNLRMAFNLNGDVGDGDPCDEDEVGVMPPYVHILIDKQFRIDYRCQTDIIEDTYGVCSNLNEIFLAAFEGSETYDVTYGHAAQISTNPNSTAVATTTTLPSVTDENGNIVHNFAITIKDSYLNSATDLSIACTVIHENLHAILLFLKYNDFLETISENPTYTELLEAYAGKIAELGSVPTFNFSNNIQHNFMVQFVDDIANTLKAYGLSKGYNLPDSYYNAMAWQGLQGSDTFIELYVNTDNSLTPEGEYIYGTLKAETANVPATYSDGTPATNQSGNQIMPLSTKCQN